MTVPVSRAASQPAACINILGASSEQCAARLPAKAIPSSVVARCHRHVESQTPEANDMRATNVSPRQCRPAACVPVHQRLHGHLAQLQAP